MAALAKLVPIVGWLPGYRRAWLSVDLLAGLSVAALVVPEGMAYAQLAGMPPQTAFSITPVALLLYAVFGTSRQLVIADSATVAVLSAAAVGALAATGSAEFIALTGALAIVTGLVMALAGVLRLGRFSQFFSESVLTGFVTGLALVIAVKQVPKVLGIEGGGQGFFDRVWLIVRHLGDTHLATLAVGAGCVALMLVVERFLPRVPVALIAVVAGIAVSALLGLDGNGVDVVGELPSGLTTPAVPDVSFEDLVTLAGSAAGLALVTFAEAIGPARSLARKHGNTIDPDAELRALGAANIGAGFFRGYPVGASLSKSAANDLAGARSAVSLLTAAVVTAVVALVLTGLFAPLPEAVLGGIVLVAVSRMVKVRQLRRLWRLRRTDFVLAAVALLGVLVLDVLPGLAVAVLVSVVAVIYRAARAGISTLGRGSDGTGLVADGSPVPGVLVVRPDGPVFFANAVAVHEAVIALLGGARTVVIDLESTTDLDVPAADMLSDLHADLSGRGVELRLARAHREVRALLAETGFTDRIGADHLHTTTEAALIR
ncbi:SulP family inorganic anion transporter [Actinokineospora terrae]|uniref:High affinity sulphate transporter 1 n=1 Tax=Actinokineospora terrae TaxID=155974 RepID=A0A1H9MFU0_9PSEU|nr:SulP family inorganic anion transporter [Actinokineospora terrae]SER22518.1 high affinity sulphate transporter 1 [Actinokineospora terrae]